VLSPPARKRPNRMGASIGSGTHRAPPSKNLGMALIGYKRVEELLKGRFASGRTSLETRT